LKEQLNVLENWLKDVRAFMQAEQKAAVGEPETLQAQLEQFTVSNHLSKPNTPFILL
jgi:hypothetical protein